jgi:hypothetical protein
VLYWLKEYKKLHDGASMPGIDAVATVVPTGDPQHPHQYITVVKSPSQYIYDPSIGIVARGEAVEADSKPLEPTIYEQFQGIAQEGSTKVTNVDKTIAEYQKDIARLDREYRVNFDIMSDKELRANREKKIRLENQIKEVTNKHDQAEKVKQDLEEGQGLLVDAPEQWYKWTLEKKQRLIKLATESITLDQIAEGWFSLKIEWSPYLGFNFVDTAYIWHQSGRGSSWSGEENEILRKYYPIEPRDTIVARMPNRTWGSICTQAGVLKIARIRRVHDQPINMNMSIIDKQVLDTYKLTLDEPDKRVWWQVASKINEGNYS